MVVAGWKRVKARYVAPYAMAVESYGRNLNSIRVGFEVSMKSP